ncbi:MAG: glycosyltransferase family 2 protein [Bryobacteraceae bacterium]|jgi:dolichol-phosphate mannosyltransferase
MPELAVVIPTFNEFQNVQPTVDAVFSALKGIDFELIFVDDDSPDGTARQVLELSRTDSRVRLVHRINRRGLSSAVVEGMMASNAPYLAVMDGDLQHDETLLPDMLRRLQTSDVDLVVGTRHREGGSMGESAWARVALSQLGRRLSALVCHAEVSDPMSGFFALRRDYLDEVVRNLSCVGFKILVDLLASSKRPVRVQEVGYTFRNRLHGHSKLDLVVGLEYLELLLHKLVGDWIPVRYALFGMIGAVGVVAQLVLIGFLLYFGRLTFDTAQVTSSLLVIGLNYAGNNQITFRDRRLRGWRWLYGLALFALACSLGLYLNLRVASGLSEIGVRWILASLAGILIASVWNYSIGAILVWRINRPAAQTAGDRVLRP